MWYNELTLIQGSRFAIIDQENAYTTALAEPLTTRERAVLGLVGQQWTNRQIAGELVLAHSTVRWYLRQIYAKLGVAGRSEAVLRARALGLIAHATSSQPGSNLPAAATPFVGRQMELQALDELLLEPYVRLVTILGPGGIGKTRLALALARRDTERRVPGSERLLFPDGVWYVSLAPITTGSHLFPAIAEALNLELEPADALKRSPEKQLCDFLRQKRLLLVLDNFEQLVEAATLLGRMMGAAPEIKVLVTSRQRLQLQGEHLFWIQGLELPEEAAGVAAARSGAVRLFANTARRVKPAFRLEGDEVATAVRICRLLEGMPLAIELAASWAAVLPLPAIEREVSRGLEILAGELCDVPARHRSVRAALHTSWERLTSEERDALSQLAIFRGGFTREAAQQVARANFPLLARLVSRTWLVYEPKQDRYQMHELLRQYAVEKLAADGAAERNVQERHSRFFCAVLAEFAEQSHGSEIRVALARVTTESANVLVAWQWAIETAAWRRLADALTGLVQYCGFGGRSEFAQATCEPLVVALAETVTEEGRRLRLRALALLASWQSGMAPRSQYGDVLEKAVTTMERAESWPYQSYVLRVLAGYEYERDRRAAAQRLEQALKLAEQNEDRHEQIAILASLATTRHHTGAVEEARRLARKGLRLANGTGSLLDRLAILYIKCQLDWYQVRLDEARRAGEAGLELAQQLDSEHHQARFLTNLGWIEWLSGRFQLACEYDGRALRFYERLEDLPMVAHVNFQLARSLLHRLSYGEATKHAVLARDQALESGYLPGVAYALSCLGDIALGRGNYKDAANLLAEAAEGLRTVGKSGQPDEMAYMLARLATAQLGLGRVEDARAALGEALAIVLETRSFKVGMVLTAAALLALQQEQVEEAVTRWTAARRLTHVRTSPWFATIAGECLTAAAQALSATQVSAAQRRGQETELWQLVGGLRI